jgi:hypothetical protein
VAIIAAELGVRTRVGFGREGRPELDTDRTAIADAVHHHAASHTDPGSWIWADHDGASLFAPIKPGTPQQQVAARLAARQEAVGGLGLLDQQMASAIGPARSPLDFTLPHQGREIVNARLRKLAVEVAEMSTAKVAVQLADVHGIGRWDLGWGCHPPNSVRAWCAWDWCSRIAHLRGNHVDTRPHRRHSVAP